MGDLPPDFPISLSSAAQNTRSLPTLSALLYRIGQERGTFRNFSEQSLRDEIDDPAKIPESSIEAPISTQSEDPRARPVQQVREEVLKLIGIALNEAALALDFTSLLSSRTRPAAVQTISPALKEAVPLASLTHDFVFQEKHEASHRDRNVAVGCKTDSLAYASKVLREASHQAIEDQRSEAVFWNELQELLDQGWPVFRANNTIHVRFGPGLANTIPLLKEGHGRIDLTNLSRDRTIKLRVALAKDGIEFARVDWPEAEIAPKSSQSVLSQILHQSKASVLATSIFSTLVREVRDMPLLAMIPDHQTITAPLLAPDSTVITFSLVDSDFDTQSPTSPGSKSPHPIVDEVSHVLLRTLATLTSTLYTQDNKCIIATLLAWLRHGYCVASLNSHLARLQRGLAQYTWPGHGPPTTSGPTSLTSTRNIPTTRGNDQSGIAAKTAGLDDDDDDRLQDTFTFHFLSYTTRIEVRSSPKSPNACTYIATITSDTGGRSPFTKPFVAYAESHVTVQLNITFQAFIVQSLVAASNGMVRRIGDARVCGTSLLRDASPNSAVGGASTQRVMPVEGDDQNGIGQCKGDEHKMVKKLDVTLHEDGTVRLALANNLTKDGVYVQDSSTYSDVPRGEMQSGPEKAISASTVRQDQADLIGTMLQLLR